MEKTKINLLNSKQVAEKLNCTPRNISLLVSKRKLTPVNDDKFYFLFSPENVESLILKTLCNAR